MILTVYITKIHSALHGLVATRTIGPQKRLYVCLDNASVVD